MSTCKSETKLTTKRSHHRALPTTTTVAIVEGGQAHTAVPRTRIVGYARQRRLFATQTREGTREALNEAFNKKTKATNVASVVLVAGFESFNRQLYPQAAASLDNIDLTVFSDGEIRTLAGRVPNPIFTNAVQQADIFIGSLIFDYDDVQVVRNVLQVADVPTRAHL